MLYLRAFLVPIQKKKYLRLNRYWIMYQKTVVYFYWEDIKKTSIFLEKAKTFLSIYRKQIQQL